MLDKQRHEAIMKNVLRDLYTHPKLQAQLAFKGGTCLYLFHDLPRFSTDLDFSLTNGAKAEQVDADIITQILREYVEIDDYFDKHFTWFWLGSYEKGKQRIKLEISKRTSLGDVYTDHDVFGLTVRSLDLATMSAHKLCAISDRKQLVHRDLYDAWWLLKKMSPINEHIIQERMNMSLTEYLPYLRNYIADHVDKKHILLGLGEVLDEPQKDWVRDHLLGELFFQIELRKDVGGR
jgi:predicted nucleotidyltransferase component of viral defense system